MLNEDGLTPGRGMGTQILCTDCHNSDDNREFGGTGPNGPHGSKFSHLLERRYDITQAPLPGQHNAEVLGMLGVSDDEVRELSDAGVLRAVT